MSYEKKYKESFKRAIVAYKDEDKHLKATLERIFPEFKESEDEKIRKEIIDYIKTGTYHKSWIAWLEKQDERKYTQKDVDDAYLKGVSTTKRMFEKQQKSAWSEEDINMIDWLIRCCEEEHKELCNDKYGHQDIVSDLKRDCRKKWDWLESLKNKAAPQNTWKPSNEQMEALKAMARYCDIATSFDAHKQRIVESLYSELKKLKEGKV